MERQTIYIPMCRFVSGSMTELRTKDHMQRPIEPEKQRYEFGVAIEKNNPDFGPFFGQFVQSAKLSWGTNAMAHQAIDQWTQTMTGFSMKMSDGDKPNNQGKYNENTKGHWVFWFSTRIPPTTYQDSGNGVNVQIPPSEVKRGYFVDITASIAANNLQPPQMGIYLNPDVIRLRASGPVIAGGIDVEGALAAMPAAGSGYVPAGAQPLGQPAPASAPMPGAGQPMAPAMPQDQPMAPQPPAAPAAPQPPAAPAAPAMPQPPMGNALPPVQPAGNPTAPVAPPVPQPMTTASPTNVMPHQTILTGPGQPQQ